MRIWKKKKKENPFDIIFWLLYVDLKISIISISIEAVFLLIAEHYIKNLEVASSSYQKVLEENRVLYNQVQDLKGFSPLSCIFWVEKIKNLMMQGAYLLNSMQEQ